MEAIAIWLDAAGLRAFAGGANYPWINSIHLLGLVMLVGAIGMVDLRIAGAWRGLPMAALSRALTPVAIVGLVILAASGLLLFAADGVALARSDTFQRKLVLIALALANAVAFRWIWRRGMGDWGDVAPTPARIMAAASVLLWLAIGLQGRLIAYS
ncbi:hypothetical protein D1610_04985 [Sphingomonas gilva]|uniref:DUF6644 domain-containing protein n=1 Tax=Sphingomonas gilva TaxID=2305907 RepID=A0A396RTZ6_9SPHN|nr:DUF6644 family protein [Sphingomonas gilva]RHW17873.1 hypothetical protein D1610_04985 [Sphingomonas gilva]